MLKSKLALTLVSALAVVGITSTPPTAEAGELFDGVSTRGVLGYGSRSMVQGFCIAKTGYSKVVIGALGAETGLSYPAATTYLTLYDTRGRKLAYNTDYRMDQSATDTNSFLRKAGVQMLAGNAAITRVLYKGCYTVVMGSDNGGNGIGFVNDYYAPKLGQR